MKIMNYIEYHNAHAQSHALRMYGVAYDTLGLLGQLDVDAAVSEAWMNQSFEPDHDPEFKMRSYLNG